MNTAKWTDDDVDTAFYLQLQDLTTVLTNNATFKFIYSYGSYVDLFNMEITGSSMWDEPRQEIKVAGYKTDVFLRSIGTMIHSDIDALKVFFARVQEVELPKFSTQLMTLLEDIRLERLVCEQRPGSKQDFMIRNKTMKQYFHTQLKVNAVRGRKLDELFCLLYLQLYADEPDPNFSSANKKQLGQLEKVKPLLFDSFSAASTRDTIRIAEQISLLLDVEYTDMQQDYFTFPIKHVEHMTEQTLFDELTRTDPLENEDSEDVNPENNNYIDESFSTWHRENENSDRKQNLLQFELEVGTKTNLMGGDVRETENGDQAMASIQGTSGESEENDYPETESLPEKKTNKGKDTDAKDKQGENKYAVAKTKEVKEPDSDDIQSYKKVKDAVESYRRKLASTIKKTLEHKQNAPHKHLLFGRLSKNFLPLIIEDDPRIFYKKSFESNEIDAVFTLLIDCSASMHNKMEETKRGIVMFHEVLRQLRIPHSIVGFWENTTDATDTYHPNYFHYVQHFDDISTQNSGAKIMQLEPEEDNRDGFSIRIMTDELLTRREKNKFLLVFSDGEPAAVNYDQNGIIDTNIAVIEARKKGIDVIGMFLSNDEISEKEETTMQNIYGKEHLMIPNIAELPERFAPLLKKLLLKSI